MNPIRHIGRLAAAATPTGTPLAFAAAAPAALTRPDPPRPLRWQLTHPLLPSWHWTGPVYKVPARAVVTAGMPGWQIALIAAAAALAAATVAVLLWTGPGPRAGNPPVGRSRAAQDQTAAADRGSTNSSDGAATVNPADGPCPRLPGVPGPPRQPTARAARRGELPVRDGISRRAA